MIDAKVGEQSQHHSLLGWEDSQRIFFFLIEEYQLPSIAAYFLL